MIHYFIIIIYVDGKKNLLFLVTLETYFYLKIRLKIKNYVISHRYAKGFGIVGYLFGDNFIFNVPNGLVGMVYYATSFILSTNLHFFDFLLNVFLCTHIGGDAYFRRHENFRFFFLFHQVFRMTTGP